MTTLINETFASGIPGGFATIRDNGGAGGTAVYNSAQQAVDLTRVANSNSAWSIDALAAQPSLSVTLDLQSISVVSDPCYFGCWFVPNVATGTQGMWVGCQVTQSASVFGLSTSGTGSYSSTTSLSPILSVGGASMQVGDRAAFTFDTYVVGSIRRYAFYRQGVLIWSFATNLVSNMQTAVGFRAGVFRLHSIVVTDSPANVEALGPAAISAPHGIPNALGVKIDRRPDAPVSYRNRGSRYRNRNYQAFNLGGAQGMVVGTTKTLATPANLPFGSTLKLFRTTDGALLGVTLSDPVTGAYAFLNVNTSDRFTVVAYDESHTYRAVVADNLSPVPM